MPEPWQLEQQVLACKIDYFCPLSPQAETLQMVFLHFPNQASTVVPSKFFFEVLGESNGSASTTAAIKQMG